MATKKRSRADSATAAIKAMTNAALGLLEPPKHVTLTEAAMNF